MRMIVGMIGGIFMFVVVLGVSLFFVSHFLENGPTSLQIVGYAFCLLLATAAGLSSFRAA